MNAYSAEAGHVRSYGSYPYFRNFLVGFLGPTKAQREVKFLEWEVEDEDGHPVKPVCSEIHQAPYALDTNQLLLFLRYVMTPRIA